MQVRCHSLQQVVYKLSRRVSRKQSFCSLIAPLELFKQLQFFAALPPPTCLIFNSQTLRNGMIEAILKLILF